MTKTTTLSLTIMARIERDGPAAHIRHIIADLKSRGLCLDLIERYHQQYGRRVIRGAWAGYTGVADPVLGVFRVLRPSQANLATQALAEQIAAFWLANR